MSLRPDVTGFADAEFRASCLRRCCMPEVKLHERLLLKAATLPDERLLVPMAIYTNPNEDAAELVGVQLWCFGRLHPQWGGAGAPLQLLNKCFV